jgi:hypothetical protein
MKTLVSRAGIEPATTALKVQLMNILLHVCAGKSGFQGFMSAHNRTGFACNGVRRGDRHFAAGLTTQRTGLTSLRSKEVHLLGRFLAQITFPANRSFMCAPRT